MKLFNKRGAALLQVLLVAAVLAGMATMLLRASFSRANMARRTRRVVSAQMLIDRCQAEVNAMWAAKGEIIFRRDLNGCYMRCTAKQSQGTTEETCTDGEKEYTCGPYTDHPNNVTDGTTYSVKATFTGDAPNADGFCTLEYELTDTSNGAHVVL